MSKVLGMSDENGRGGKSIFSVQSLFLLRDFGGLFLLAWNAAVLDRVSPGPRSSRLADNRGQFSRARSVSAKVVEAFRYRWLTHHYASSAQFFVSCIRFPPLRWSKSLLHLLESRGQQRTAVKIIRDPESKARTAKRMSRSPRLDFINTQF